WPPHFLVINSNLVTINTRTIGSVLTLHLHLHLSPLEPLARKREGSAKRATCSVAQSKPGWSMRSSSSQTAACARRDRKQAFLVTTGHCSPATRHSPLTTCHPPYP